MCSAWFGPLGSSCRRNPSCFTILLIAFPGFSDAAVSWYYRLPLVRSFALPQPAANHILLWATTNFVQHPAVFENLVLDRAGIPLITESGCAVGQRSNGTALGCDY